MAVEVAPGETVEVTAAPAPNTLTAGEAVEVLVEARLAEEHAAEAVEGVETLEERVEECQTETELRLSALETRLADLPTLNDLERIVQAQLSDLRPEPSSLASPITSEEPAEILETLAEDPETLLAASQETGLPETTISETLTEASSATRTEAPESAPAVVLVAEPPLPRNRVRFV